MHAGGVRGRGWKYAPSSDDCRMRLRNDNAILAWGYCTTVTVHKWTEMSSLRCVLFVPFYYMRPRGSYGHTQAARQNKSRLHFAVEMR